MTIQLKIPNMACAACSETITNAVIAILHRRGYANDPTATVQANLQTKQVDIETQATPGAIESAITAAGYQVVA